MKPSIAPSLSHPKSEVDSLVRGAEAQLLGMTAPPGAFRRELDPQTQLARISAAIEQLEAARRILSPTESLSPLSGASDLITVEVDGRSWIGNTPVVSSHCDFKIEVVGAESTLDLIGDFSEISFSAPIGVIPSGPNRSDLPNGEGEVATKTGA